MQEDAAWPGRRMRVLAVVGPVVLAVFALGGTVGAAHRQLERHDLDALAVVLVLAGPLALLRIRQNPVPVLWFVCGVTLAYLLRGYPYGPVFASLAVAVVCAVALGHRLAAWLAVGVLLVAHWSLRGVLLDEPWSWGEFFGVCAWSLVLLSAGEVIRVRRERAQSAPAHPGRDPATAGQRGAAADRARAARRRRAPHVADQRAGRRRPAPGRPQARAGADRADGHQGRQQGGAGRAARARRRAPRRDRGRPALPGVDARLARRPGRAQRARRPDGAQGRRG